jgi:hypothetical protein
VSGLSNLMTATWLGLKARMPRIASLSIDVIFSARRTPSRRSRHQTAKIPPRRSPPPDITKGRS